MKTILRNFLSVIGRFKMATLLNLLGLSVAFTVVIVILMQVHYDLSFDSHHKQVEEVYRMSVRYDGRKLTVLPRPLVDGFKAYSPHVKASAITNALMSQMGNLFFGVEREGQQFYYTEKITSVTDDYFDVFHFDMAEGVVEKVKEPGTALIPQSMAEKMFGNESPVGQKLNYEEWALTIVGVRQRTDHRHRPQ